MTRNKWMGVGAGLSLVGLAVGGVIFQSIARERRRRAEIEDFVRVTDWEAEGGALREPNDSVAQSSPPNRWH